MANDKRVTVHVISPTKQSSADPKQVAGQQQFAAALAAIAAELGMSVLEKASENKYHFGSKKQSIAVENRKGTATGVGKAYLVGFVVDGVDNIIDWQGKPIASTVKQQFKDGLSTKDFLETFRALAMAIKPQEAKATEPEAKPAEAEQPVAEAADEATEEEQG